MGDDRTADQRFDDWWCAQALRGDPLRNPHLVRGAFDAGLLVGLERAAKNRDYLREKNDIIKAYAGPSGMTPEDVAAALERIPELERERDAARRLHANVYANYRDACRALDEVGIPEHGPRKPDGFAEAHGLEQRIRLLVERAERVEVAAREIVRDEAFCEDEPPTVTALRAALAAAPSVDANAYHEPLAAAFQQREKVAEVAEGDFEPEAAAPAEEGE